MRAALSGNDVLMYVVWAAYEMYGQDMSSNR